MTTEAIAQILTVIAEEYQVEFTEARRAIWAAALADLSDEEGQTALAIHLRTNRFAPHPADLVVAIRGSPKDAQAFLDEEADVAVRHLETHLSDHQPVDLGPHLNAVVRAMGGPDAVVAQITATESWPYRRAEARRLYLAFRRRGVSPEMATPQLPRTVLESLNADPAQWRSPTVSQEEYRRNMTAPVSQPFLPDPAKPALPTG